MPFGAGWDRLGVVVRSWRSECRELQVSEQTYYRWRNQFGLKTDDAKRLKDVERENAANGCWPMGRLRVGDLAQLEHLGAAMVEQHDRTHDR